MTILRWAICAVWLLLCAGCAAPAAPPAVLLAPSIVPTPSPALPVPAAVHLPLVAAAPPLLPTATPTALPLPPTPTDLPPTATPPPTLTVLPSPVPTPVPTATPALPVIGRLEYGIAAHLFYTNRELPLQRAQAAGFGWIRQQIHWRDVEGPAGRYGWEELDKIVASVQAYRLKLLLSIVRAPSFYTSDGSGGLPDDPATLGRFVAALVERYQGRIHAIEIWNEQNLAHETGGQISLEDAGRYVELLKATYPRIKAIDPAIVVLAGAPSSTGVTDPLLAVDDQQYYAAMYTYDGGIIREYMDAQAVHPGGAANPPDTLWPENPSTAEGWTEHPTFYFRHVENVRRLMEQADLGDKPIWITEFGWATTNTTPGYEFGNQVTFEQQAQYLAGAMQLAHERYPWVGAMFVWNLNFAMLRAQNGQPLHEQASYGILNGVGAPRPAWYAIRSFLEDIGYR